jgi:chromosomal replication initiation ATPase DnaA
MPRHRQAVAKRRRMTRDLMSVQLPAMAKVESQLLLEIGLPGSMERDDLVVAPSNRDAVILIESWPDWPGPSVVIAGPPGSGKTHLGQIWRQEAGAHACEPSQLNTGDLQSALSGEPILIDGIEPGAFDEDLLFHIMNAVRSNGGTLLMTSAHWPGAWRVETPDLRSRIAAATTVEIGEPDDALLVGVMAKLFADRQITVESGVIRYIAMRIERSLSSAVSTVDRLDRASLARKSRITRAFASSFVREYDASQSEFEF